MQPATRELVVVPQGLPDQQVLRVTPARVEVQQDQQDYKDDKALPELMAQRVHKAARVFKARRVHRGRQVYKVAQVR